MSDDKSLFINNIQAESNDYKEYENLSLNEFYIIGAWNNKNQLELSEIIKNAVLNGIGNIKFQNSNKIILNLGEQCSIDSVIISAIYNLFMKDFVSYKNKKIKTSSKNKLLLKRSTGYNLIKKFL